MRLRQVRGGRRTNGSPRTSREIDGRRRIELTREDVEPAKLRTADEECIKLARLGRAEVPAFPGAPVVRAAFIEKSPEILDGVGGLVIPQQDRPDTAAIGIRAEEDVHVAAAYVIVAVRPVRIADVPQTIARVRAVLRVGQANPFGVVWRRKGELSCCIAGRQERLYLGSGKPRAQRQ